MQFESVRGGFADGAPGASAAACGELWDYACVCFGECGGCGGGAGCANAGGAVAGLVAMRLACKPFREDNKDNSF